MRKYEWHAVIPGIPFHAPEGHELDGPTLVFKDPTDGQWTERELDEDEREEYGPCQTIKLREYRVEASPEPRPAAIEKDSTSNDIICTQAC
eukprot:3933155-Rhodomonas_salina.1